MITWEIRPIGDGLWRAEVIADADTISDIEEICLNVQEKEKENE